MNRQHERVITGRSSGKQRNHGSDFEGVIVVIQGRNRYLQLEQKLDFLDIFF